MLGDIYDYVTKNDLSVHQKVVLIWLLTNKREDFPKLPPELCPCKITLKDGSNFNAYLDKLVCGNRWNEYGFNNHIRKYGRRTWEYEEVEKWEFI